MEYQTSEEIARDVRISKLRDMLKTVPLSAFMASDLDALQKVSGITPYHFKPTEGDLNLLEGRISEYKKMHYNLTGHFS